MKDIQLVIRYRKFEVKGIDKGIIVVGYIEVRILKVVGAKEGVLLL